jgi:hypothetical protein
VPLAPLVARERRHPRRRSVAGEREIFADELLYLREPPDTTSMKDGKLRLQVLISERASRLPGRRPLPR